MCNISCPCIKILVIHWNSNLTNSNHSAVHVIFFWVESTPPFCDINSPILLWEFHWYGEHPQLNVQVCIWVMWLAVSVLLMAGKAFPSDISWLRTSINQVKLYLCLHIFLTFYFYNKTYRTEHYKMCSCSMKTYFIFQNKTESIYIAWPTGNILVAANSSNHHYCLWCT
jgi:hypothetical protein